MPGRDGLWRFNKSEPDENICTADSSGNGKNAYLNDCISTEQPIFYLSLIHGKLELIFYTFSGSLILDTSASLSFDLENAKWYFIVAVTVAKCEHPRI